MSQQQDPNQPWWLGQVRGLVQTFGISTVLLGIVLWMFYSLGSQAIDSFKPYLAEVTQEHLTFVRQQNETLKQQVLLISELVQVSKQQADQLNRIEAALNVPNNKPK